VSQVEGHRFSRYDRFPLGVSTAWPQIFQSFSLRGDLGVPKNDKVYFGAHFDPAKAYYELQLVHMYQLRAL
jgi:hypothetical protein